jgi:hypothetical protein
VRERLLFRRLVQGQVELPSWSVQSEFAEWIITLERARKSADERLKAAKRLPAAYLRVAFDYPKAQRWARRTLGHILSLRKEVVHPGDGPAGSAVFVGLEHIEPGTGRRTGGVEVDVSRLTGRKPRFRKGDIVYGYLRPYLNKVWVADLEGLCSVDQYVYVVDGTVAEPDFVAWFMRSPVYLARAPVALAPGQLPRIRTGEVASVEIELPPLAEQRRIVAMLNEQMAVVERMRKGIEGEREGINALARALLHGTSAASGAGPASKIGMIFYGPTGSMD